MENFILSEASYHKNKLNKDLWQAGMIQLLRDIGQAFESRSVVRPQFGRSNGPWTQCPALSKGLEQLGNSSRGKSLTNFTPFIYNTEIESF